MLRLGGLSGFWTMLKENLSNPLPITRSSLATSPSPPTNTERAHKNFPPVRKILRRVGKLGPGWIRWIQLAYWDDLTGPVMQEVWLSDHETFNMEQQLLLAKMCLCGEMGMESAHDTLETKFYMLAQLDSLMLSMLFSAPSPDSTAGTGTSPSLLRYAVSIVWNVSDLERYLQVRLVVHEKTALLANTLRALLTATPRPAFDIWVQLLPCWSLQITHLRSAFLPLELPRPYSRPLDALTRFPQVFLARAITSHIQTLYHTLILGNDESDINALISLLSAFSPGDVKKCSVFVEADRPYIPDLFIQGLLQLAVEGSALIESSFPSTVIVLGREGEKFEVWQTLPFHQYRAVRNVYLRSQADSLLGAPEGDTVEMLVPVPPRPSTRFPQPVIGSPISDLLAPYRASARVVSQLVAHLARMSPLLADNFLKQSLRALQSKATCLVMYIRARELPHQSELPLTRKVVRETFDLQDDADFNLLLSLAELQSPGCYALMYGNPAAIAEQFVQLMDSF